MMTAGWTARRAGVAAMLAAGAGCAPAPPPRPVEMAPPPPLVADAEAADPTLRSTIMPGEIPTPATPQAGGMASAPLPRGNVTLNFPGSDVRAVAQGVADAIGRRVLVDPAVTGTVSLVTPGPVSRTAVLGLFEAALRAANLALVPVEDGFIVQTVAAAQAAGPVNPTTVGFGTEVVQLKFINADEVRKVIDGVLPGVVTATDPARNAITIAGTTGQRASARDLLRQFDVDWLRAVNFALFVPQRTDSRLIVPELEKLINAPDSPTRGLVRLISMERLNGILAVTGQRQYIEDVRRWIDILDREGESSEPRVFVYRVQNGRARDLAQTLNAALGLGSGNFGAASNDPFAPPPRSDARATGAIGQTPPAGGPGQSPAAAGSNPLPGAVGGGGGGIPAPGGAPPAGAPTARITADEVNNAIVVFGTPRDYAVVEDALRKLDVAPYQVLIEAAITEVGLTDSLRYGVQWNWLTGQSNFSLSEGTTPTPVRNLPGFSYFLAGNDITATLNALEVRTNVKIISAPKLVVLNNQTAALQVGDQVPVSSGTAVSVQNPNAPVVNAIEYRDTGVILKVTPRVNAGGLVLLDVAQEVSAVSSQASTSTTSTGSSPTISTRRISTSVAVQDGQVIALGGLFRDSQSFGKDGVPILSRIPVLGALFGNQRIEQNRTELIVLLKPHVLRTPDDGRAITEELRTKLRTLEPFRTQGTIP